MRVQVFTLADFLRPTRPVEYDPSQIIPHDFALPPEGYKIRGGHRKFVLFSMSGTDEYVIVVGPSCVTCSAYEHSELVSKCKDILPKRQWEAVGGGFIVFSFDGKQWSAMFCGESNYGPCDYRLMDVLQSDLASQLQMEVVMMVGERAFF